MGRPKVEIKEFCIICGKKFTIKPSQRFRIITCSRECKIINMRNRSLKKRPAGSTSIDKKTGYVLVKVLNTGKRKRTWLWEREHRVVMEKHIGRKLHPAEVVHHINKNIVDNRVKNLQIISQAEHNVIHQTGHKDYGGWKACVRKNNGQLGQKPIAFERTCPSRPTHHQTYE